MGRPKGLRKGPDGKWYQSLSTGLKEVEDHLKKTAEIPKRRGRKKGMRKGPDGKMYLPGEYNAQNNSKVHDVSIKPVVAPAIDSVPAEPVTRAVKAIKRDYYMRNDLVRYKEETYVVLGHANGTVYVQAVFDPNTRMSIPEGELL